MSFEETGGGMAGPLWLVVAVVLVRALHRELSRDVVPPAPLEYSCCTPCELRARDASQLGRGLLIAGGVGVLGAATAGFNDAPVLGVGILLVTIVGVWLAHRKLMNGRRLSARVRGTEVALKGIHGDMVQALLLVRLAPADADVPGA